MERLTQEQRAAADAAFANGLNVIHHAYVDMAGDLVAGALLGQVLYWFGAGKDGRQRARIEKDGHTWIAKARTDWWEEIRISPKQYDRAAKILADKGLIEIKTFKFNGSPTKHLRIVPEAFNAALDEWKRERVKTIFPDGEKPGAAPFPPMGNNDIPEEGNSFYPDGEEGNAPSGNMEVPESGRTLTETPSETTPETTAEPEEKPSAPPTDGPHASRHSRTLEQLERDFEAVWAEYPRKVGKTKARRAFERAVRGMGARKATGEPYTAAEIMAETVLFRQYIEQQLQAGKLEPQYVPTGGAWFGREGWVDETPSIAGTFPDLLEAMEYKRNASELRKCASRAARAPEQDRPAIFERMQRVRALLPY